VGTVGVDENSTLNTVIYPNPVVDILTIQASQSITKLTVFNAIGQVVYTESGTDIELLNVMSLSKGYYYLVLNSNEGRNMHQIQIIK